MACNYKIFKAHSRVITLQRISYLLHILTTTYNILNIIHSWIKKYILITSYTRHCTLLNSSRTCCLRIIKTSCVHQVVYVYFESQ